MEMKERIQQKAHDLFNRYGIRSITMDEIAAQLSVSKKTIYQYFSDKDELVEAVTGKIINYSQECCLRDKALASNAVDEIFKVLDFVEVIFRNMNPSMLYDLEKYHPKAFRKFLEYRNKFLLAMIRQNLERGIVEELYRPEINVDIYAKLRLESMMAAFNQELFPANKYNLVEVHQQLIEHFLFGVASMKGYKLIIKYKQERIKSKVP
jgi:TetR/AcrR family transcriptional regulator, cholesterol catabolism regulator